MTADGERLVLFHPRAGVFRTRRGAALLAGLSAHLGPSCRLLPGDAPDVRTRLAGLDAERDVVVVAGGDGTLFHVLNELDAVRGTDWPRLALVPAGTGNDAARSIGPLVGRDLRDLAALADAVGRAAAGAPGDLAVLTWQDRRRVFHNFAGCGAPVDWARMADARAMALLKRRLPALCYTLCSLGVLLRNRNTPVDVDTGAGASAPAPAFAVFVANTRFLGGGMDFGAGVRIDSGEVAVLHLPATSRWRLLGLLHGVGSGSGPRLEAAARVVLSLPGAARLNLDGELVDLGPQAVVASIEVLPGRLRWI